MVHYRAYAVRLDGNFDGYEALTCLDDDDAIADSTAIELWSGERFITRLEREAIAN